MIEIRRESLDSPAAQALIRALDDELTAMYPEEGTVNHFRLDPREVAPGRGAFFVAYRMGRAVACGALRLLDPRTAEIKRMYVEPGARGGGVGRRMLEVLEAEALALGARVLMLETGVRQEAAVALYRRAGFQATGAFGEYEEHPLSLFLRKELPMSRTPEAAR